MTVDFIRLLFSYKIFVSLYFFGEYYIPFCFRFKFIYIVFLIKYMYVCMYAYMSLQKKINKLIVVIVYVLCSFVKELLLLL